MAVKGLRARARLELEPLEDRTMPSTGLVAAYGFAEGSGTSVGDASGNGNVGTISNASWVQGKYGTALKFTGATNSYVTIPDASSLDLANPLTLEAWVDPSSFTSPDNGWIAAVAKDHPNSSNDVSYALYAATGTNTPPGEHILVSSGDVAVSATSKLSLNTWAFLAATYDGASMKIYVNGTLIKSKAQTGSITEVNAPLRIGGDWSGEMFTGIIDEVRVYNIALTQTQIQSDMNTPISSLTLTPSTLPADTIAVPYNQSVTTTGGTGNVNLAVSNVQNAIPGLSVPSSAANTLNISGTPTSTGTETFTITATDQAGNTTSGNYSITVNAAVILNPGSLPADTINVAYNQTITASSGTGNKTLSVSNLQNAIPGLTVPNSGTNSLTITGTPTATGTETFTVTATDQAGGTTSVNYSITVNSAVTLGPGSLPADTLQVAYNQTITASGGTGNKSLAVSNVQNAIPGLVLPGSGTNSLAIGGTPTATGTETFTLTATDQVGGTTHTNYSITVNPLPTLSPGSLPASTQGVAYNQTITASGGTGNIGIAVSDIQNPIAGLNIPTSGSNTLAISGTPTVAGTVTFTVTPTDMLGAQGTPVQFSITINAPIGFTPPTLPSAVVGSLYNQAISATGGTGNRSLVVTNLTGSIPGMTVPSSGTNAITIQGTPTGTGTVSFTLNATDTVGASATPVNYTLNAVLGLVLVPSALPADTINVPYSQTLSTSNGIGTVNIVISNLQNPIAGLNVPISGTDTLSISGIPTATGTETFTATATDQVGNTATANYGILVDPAISIAPGTLPPGTASNAYNQTITATGGTGSKSLAVSNLQNAIPGLTVPDGGTNTLTISGTPTAPGTVTFTVTATDQVGATTSTDYSITINPAIVISPASLPTGTVANAFSVTFTSSGGSGAGYTYTETGSLPSGLSLTSSGVLSGIPSQSGSYSITVTASDSIGGTGSQAYTLKVNPAVVVSPSSLPNATINSAYSAAFTATGGSGGGYSFAESGALPAGLSFSQSGVLSGTPTQTGTFTLTVTATDSNGGTGSVTDSLTVKSATAPSVSITSPTSGSQLAGSFTITATARSSIGISGVQFSVDGVNVGGMVTSAPYQVTWDSTKVADGSHTLSAKAVDTSGNSATSSVTVQIVNGGVFGSVINMPDSPVTGNPVVPINMVLLDNGKILFWDGGPDCLGAVTDFIWDTSTNTFANVDLENQQEVRDIFCSDQTVLANGDVLVAGGHDCTSPTYIGTAIANLFDPSTNTWTFLPDMNNRRWYPNALTLPNGRVLVTAGSAKSTLDYNPIPEVYDPVANTWTDLANANQTIPNYPFMFVLPNGNVMAAGSDEAKMASYELNVATQTWTTVDSTVLDAGSAVEYLPGKIMKTGSSYLSAPPDNGGSTPSAATTYVIDMNQSNPAWQQTASMANPRTHLNLTILPDDTVLATGGSTDIGGVNPANAVYQAELWSPTTQTWSPMASEQIPRLYHSTAVLLPDGRVVVAGGGHNYYNSIADPNAEIYSPAYLFKGARPTISQAPPTNLGYNQSFFVGTPDAANIASVSLIRNGSDTHAFNTDQNYIPLSFTQTLGGLTVQSPANDNLAPPGYYMLFIVNKNGVPSIAPMVRLPAPYEDTQPPTAPSNLTATGGVENVKLTWTASTDNVGVTQYNIYRSTTSGFTPSSTNLIGTSATASYTDNIGPGIYYYLVTAQDAVDNVSPPSNQATGTAQSPIKLIQDAVQGFEYSVSQLSVALPTNVAAGDFLIVTGTAARPSSSITVSDTAGNTFVSAIGPVTDPAQNVTAYIWYVANAKGGADTVTVSPNGGADAMEIHASEWSGINPNSPLDQISWATGTGTAISSGAKITTKNGELVYGYTFPNQSATVGTGFAGLTLVDGDWDEYQLQSVAGSVAATFTQPSDAWLAMMATFTPQYGDTQPPSAPTNLAASGAIGAVSLTWTASTDNVGVTQYNIYRSTASGFVPSSSSLIGTSTTTNYTDYVPAGTYYYLVTAQDAAGNISQPSNEASGTSKPDNIPPSVAMTSPASGTTVSGTVAVAANASDNVAVASVQFVLDGTNYGSPITTSPYSFSWNSATVANGTHTWAAIATDTSGNTATSATDSFSVNNSALPGEVASYSLDEGSGATVNDSSGNNNQGAVANATWAAGHFGNALKFNGATNSMVTINNSSSLALTSGLTLEAWVNPSTLASADSGWVAAIAKDHQNSSNDIAYALYAANGTGTPPALHLLIGGHDVGVQGTSVLALNTWTFLAATYDGTTMRLYVNGSQVATRSQTGAITTTTDPLRIGGDWSGEMFTGLIDNVRIYNRALSASDITSDMNTPISARPLHAQAATAGGGGEPLTPSLLMGVVPEAIALWAAAGVSSDRLQVLNDMHLEVRDLPSPYLGLTSGNQIWISRDAQGFGWFTNPGDNAAFTTGQVHGMDLLTTVVHEFGHVLNLEHDDGYSAMAEWLPPGTRRFPVVTTDNTGTTTAATNGVSTAGDSPLTVVIANVAPGNPPDAWLAALASVSDLLSLPLSVGSKLPLQGLTPLISTSRRRTSSPGVPSTPSATSVAIFAVWPLAESYSTSTLPIAVLRRGRLGT
jgi:hypothetical protein